MKRSKVGHLSKGNSSNISYFLLLIDTVSVTALHTKFSTCTKGNQLKIDTTDSTAESYREIPPNPG